MSRGNKRGTKKPQIKKVFALIVDGDDESWYIEQLKKHERDILVGLNLRPELPKTKGLEVSYKLIEKLEEEGYDKIFWIIDFDKIIEETKGQNNGKQTKLDKLRDYYKKLSHNEKIVIIINNPCLEYWFLQHFIQTSKFFSSYDELKKILKKHIKDYDKTEKFYYNCHGRKGIYSFLKQKLETAILNSKKLANFTFNETDVKSYETGVTEMYKLFEELKIK
jgi:hypothetical protein